MTVSNSTSRWEYNGDGVTTVFAFDNIVFAPGDLKVYVDGELVLGFTVSGVDNAAGGNVTLPTPAPAGTRNVVIVRQVPATQALDFPEGNPIPSRALSKGLDKLTVLVQQLKVITDRKMGLADSSTYSGSLSLPDPIAGRALKWADDGLALVNSGNDPDQAAEIAEAAAGRAENFRDAAETLSTLAGSQASLAVTAKNQAQDSAVAAQTYASAAQAAAVSNLYATITDITADRTLLPGDNGACFRIDASAGPVVVTVPAKAALTSDWRVGFVRLDASANAITVQVTGGSGNTIDGELSFALTQQHDSATVLANAGTSDFSAIVNPDDQTLARINTAQTWSAAQGYTYQAIAYSATPGWNVKAKPAASLDMMGNPTITATGIEDGRVYQLRVYHNGAARTPAFDAAVFKWGDDGQPSFSAAAGKTDYMVFVGKGTTELHHMGTKTGF